MSVTNDPTTVPNLLGAAFVGEEEAAKQVKAFNTSALGSAFTDPSPEENLSPSFPRTPGQAASARGEAFEDPTQEPKSMPLGTVQGHTQAADEVPAMPSAFAEPADPNSMIPVSDTPVVGQTRRAGKKADKADSSETPLIRAAAPATNPPPGTDTPVNAPILPPYGPEVSPAPVNREATK